MTKINKEKEALLPQKRLRGVLMYNTLTREFVWRVKPHPKAHSSKVGEVAGTVTQVGYVKITIDGSPYLAHRLIWLYVHGEFPAGEQSFIDHIDGNPSNNKIDNLRTTSSAENNRSKKKSSTNSSGLIGISRVEIPVKREFRTYTYWSWRAYWQAENGKQCAKDFYIRTHGEDEAKQMAIEYRAKQIHLLEINHGIIYSERHGT